MVEVNFKAISMITLSTNPGGKSSNLKQIKLMLEVDDKVDAAHYIQEPFLRSKSGPPTQGGVKILTQALVQGLAANIHGAHQEGWWDSAEHLRYIIAELERSFALPVTVKTAAFDDENG